MNFEIGDIVIYNGNQLRSRRGDMGVITGKDERRGSKVYTFKFIKDGFEHRACYDLFRFVSKDTTPKIKIKRPDVDPFDEEDWGYEKIEESLENIMKFEAGDIVIYNGKKYLNRRGEECIIIKELEDDKNIYLIQFLKDELKHEVRYDLLQFVSKDATPKIKIKRPDVDPFDEEDWGYEKIEESLENNMDFEVGDVVICNGPHRKGETCVITYIYNSIKVCKIEYEIDGEVNYCFFQDLKPLKERKTKQIFTEEDPFGEENWEVDEKLNANPFLEKEWDVNITKNEEVQNIYDSNPFLEKEWSVNESKNELLKKILQGCKIKFENDEELILICDTLIELGFTVFEYSYNFLNPNFERDLRKYGFNSIEKGHNCDFCLGFFNDTWNDALLNIKKIGIEQFLEFVEKHSDIKNKKIKKIENSEIDPFNEEDWGFEYENKKDIIKKSNPFLEKEWSVNENENEHENLKKILQDYRIKFKNAEESFLISEILIEKGFTVFEYSRENHRKRIRSGKYDAIVKGVTCDFCLGYTVSHNNNSIDNVIEIKELENLLKMRIKELKKIKKPEIDPFGEEDWGYETIQESSKEEFKIGDIVIVNGHLDGVDFNNDVGTIIKKYSGGSYDWAIEFLDKVSNSLYSCEGMVPSGKGFLIKQDMISHLDIPLEKPKIKWYNKGKLGNWEIKESSKIIFEIGDTVIVNGYLDGVDFHDDIGIIRGKSNGYQLGYYQWVIEFIEKDYEGLHKCEGMVPSGKGFHIRDYMVTPVDGKLKKIKIERPEIDPFNEEDWGYEKIDESLDDEDLTGCEVKITSSSRKELVGKVGTIVDMHNSSNVYLIKFNTKIIPSLHNGHGRTCNYIDETECSWFFRKTSFKIIELPKNSKKIERPELDPFGEEDWGYEKIDENKLNV